MEYVIVFAAFVAGLVIGQVPGYLLFRSLVVGDGPNGEEATDVFKDYP